MRRRTAVVGAVVLAALIVGAACAPMQVHTYMPRSADLARYHTYGWAAAGVFDTGDPRLDNNTLFIERLQSAVEQQLAKKGWARAAADESDLVIHFHARIKERQGEGRSVYDDGTLFLDFVEPRSNTLVWRGWAEGGVDGVIDDQAWMNQQIDTAVARILMAFPARS